MHYFGTDGIRGEYNSFLTLELVDKACSGFASILQAGDVVVVGQDPRISSEAIFKQVITSLNYNGINVIDLGVIPTPVVSLMIKHHQAQGGIMISASHNPFSDNGIKFFNENGVKIDDQQEALIEEFINHPISLNRNEAITTYYEASGDYLNIVKQLCGDLSDFKIAIDVANGATYRLAKDVFLKLGCELIVVADQPDGYNINDNVGALHPNTLAQVVKEQNCDCGFCYDGDGDRLIVIDHLGNILSGDHIMCLLASLLKEQNKLAHNTLVATVMSNLGLINTLKDLNITTLMTDVGDRYVISKMMEGGYNLGGEQSGHIILSDYITTGDGVLASVVLANLLIRNREVFNNIYNFLPIYPQLLTNIAVKDKHRIMQDKTLLALIDKYNEELKDHGRVLIRASGTEQLVRIMVEAQDENIVKQVTKEFSDLINRIK